MIERPQRVELLAPAGSREAFEGAVSAGADAVYLGGERFGARAYAENFSDEEILRTIEDAHIFGRKVYLTANVLTREEELPDLVDFVKKLYEGGLDGVIVQDTGVLAALGHACPGLPLHASTQMSVTGAEAVRYLQRFGVCRVVPARELSIDEIRTLRREATDVEVEAFIHGAMCYSYSGRCLMSSFLGGRSGNRGRCAGTCRLPFRVLDGEGRPAGPDARKKEVWPLSMKDMCVLSILPELIDAGIHSFKIEGRMKKPVYAAGVTAVYRKYIDRYYDWDRAGRQTPWVVEPADLDMLRSLYIRTDLGTGYYHQRNGRSLVTIGQPGYAGTDEKLEAEIGRKYLGGLPKLEIEGRAAFRIGEPARLEVWTKDSTVMASVEGAPVQAATGRPLDPVELSTRLRKTGDSLFVFSDLDVEAGDGLFLPVSAVNALRRDALQSLKEELLKRGKRENLSAGVDRQKAAGGDRQDTAGTNRQKTAGEDLQKTAAGDPETGNVSGGPAGLSDPQNSGGKQEIWAMVSDSRQMKAAAEAGCDCIVTDGDFRPEAFESGKPDESIENINLIENKNLKTRWMCALPPVFRVSDREKIRDMIRTAPERGFDGILVRTLEELQLAKEEGYGGEIAADASLYSWNSLSLGNLLTDCGRVVCSLELHQKDILRAADNTCPLNGEHRAAEKPETSAIRPEADREDVLPADRLILPVYGRVPMMETAGCVRKTENSCSHQDGFWFLEDRKGRRLPVRCRCGTCSNTVYNAVPLSLHQFAGKGLCARAPVLLCMFTTETAAQTGQILKFFSRISGSSGKPEKRSRKKKAGVSADLPFTEFTNGHFRSGAL